MHNVIHGCSIGGQESKKFKAMDKEWKSRHFEEINSLHFEVERLKIVRGGGCSGGGCGGGGCGGGGCGGVVVGGGCGGGSCGDDYVFCCGNDDVFGCGCYCCDGYNQHNLVCDVVVVAMMVVNNGLMVVGIVVVVM